jgi:hypothetical protein
MRRAIIVTILWIVALAVVLWLVNQPWANRPI